MPRPKDSFKLTPAYRLHKTSGRAVVTLDGHEVYLGPHGTKTSKDEYDRVVGEWLANGRRLATGPGVTDSKIVEMLLAYWKHAKAYYGTGPDGERSGELHCHREVVKLLKEHYGHKLVPAVRGQHRFHQPLHHHQWPRWRDHQ